ncbi:hypothetical protein PMAYCL1PPCAC_03357 [Pristionchus mayeri]|uniref:Uncharacterized protein n=1 Tax=Pristionchus mayeri TaxID=1317129 RepID=A0AAN4Z8B7_9BILA|nr:hypothetical protein PMAYCL1PPCAC_03357 [Pristionchus mayeri]
MGTMIRVLIAISLLFFLSECSQKYDAKWDKNDIRGGPEEDKEYWGVVGDAPKGNGICYWQGGFWCNPGDYCDTGYTYVTETAGSANSPLAGESGAMCWLGKRYICCLKEHVKKDPLVSCHSNVGAICKPDEQLLYYISWTNWAKCCDAGTIVL